MSGIEDVLKELEQWPEIGEVLFKEKYLQGLIDRDEDVCRGWLKVCIKPTLPVNVVNARGEIVAVVPPLLTRRKFNLQNINISELLIKTSNIHNSSPAAANNFLDANLRKFFTDGDHSAHFDQWKHIIEYFNVKPKNVTIKTEVEDEIVEDWE